MKKACFSFRAVCAGSGLYRFFLGKMNRRPLRKLGMAAAASAVISTGASAQCNTFKNADKANPLISVIDSTKDLAGFAFADIDADGDQDVYVSYRDHSYPLKPTHLSFFRNTGTKDHPVYKADAETGFGQQLAGHSNRFLQFADIDGDGDLDYFVADDTKNYFDFPGILFYKNTGTLAVPKFDTGYKNPLPAVTSHGYQPFTLVDMDGDSDLDFYACDVTPDGGTAYGQKIYFNIGRANRPKFDSPVQGGNDHNSDRTYYDWNNDGLVDFFGFSYFINGINYNKNIGPKSDPDYQFASAEAPSFKHGAPYRMLDLNNDGAPEVFDFEARFSILPPVAVIEDTVKTVGNKPVTFLSSKNIGPNFSYRWERNGLTIPGANAYFIKAKKPGTYTLYLTNTCGTGVSLDYKLKLNDTLSAEAEREVAGIAGIISVSVKASPNPFVNTVTLQLPGTACTVNINDMAGRLLFTQTTSAAMLQAGGNLKPGVYFVSVWKGKEEIFKTKIVKQ